MKKIFFLGTCQLMNIANFLSELSDFNDKYSVNKKLRIDMASAQDVKNLDLLYSNADIIITQPIFSDKYSKACTKYIINYAANHKKELLIIPYIHFSGYNPHIRYAKTLHCGEYHCCATLYFYLLNYNMGKAIARLRNFFYKKNDFFKKASSDSLAELERREKIISAMHPNMIHIANWFKCKYKNIRLMETHNHPSQALFVELTKRISLNLNLNFDENIIHRVKFGDDYFPIYKGIKSSIPLKFTNEEQKYNDEIFYIDKNGYCLEEFIAKSYIQYEKIPEDVVFIADLHKKHIEYLSEKALNSYTAT